MLTVLKLGGSVITRKDDPETVDRANLERAADAIADAALEENGHDGLVLVHGGGSFGHHRAEVHGVDVTEGIREAPAIRDVHASMQRLNETVLDVLHERDVPALPVHPLSVASRNRHGDLAIGLEAVDAMVEEGFVPVLHGDVVVHDGRGATVLSGDEQVAALASSLGADRVGVCSSLPGVIAGFDDAAGAGAETGPNGRENGPDGRENGPNRKEAAPSDGEPDVVARIRSFDEVADLLGGSDATDVTGGMAGKVRELLQIDPPAHVFGLDDLPAFLAGGEPGTRIG